MTSMLAEERDAGLDELIAAANQRLQSGDTEGALAQLGPLTSDAVIYLPARFLLAMVAWKMGQLDWSLKLMRDCHERWPMHGTVAEVLASLYAQAGNLHESLFMGKMSTALGGPSEFIDFIPAGFPNFDRAFYSIKDRPRLALAKSSLASGNLGLAVEYARQHSALNPDDGDAYAFLADLLLRSRQASAAVGVLEAVEGHIADNAGFPPATASLYAKALAANGETAAARRWHEQAVERAPDDLSITAAQIADLGWLESDATHRRRLGRQWAEHFCPRSSKPREWHRLDGKLVIGYLVSGFNDPLDAAAVAAVARAHDRSRVTVIGYGFGAQDWQGNALLSGAFDNWVDIRGLDPATLSRYFVRGGAHVIVDVSGFAAPVSLLALARVQTAIRVSWLGNPARIEDPIYDAQIAANSDLATSGNSWAIRGGYPILRPLQQDRTVRGSRHDGINLGADVWMAQLDHPTVKLWSSVLEALPQANLLLRAHDMGSDGNVQRLIERFGTTLAARIDIVDVGTAEEFYALIDVALTPFRGASPRMAADALASGVPVVALDLKDAANPYPAFLRDFGLDHSLVASNERDYIAKVQAVAATGAARDETEATIAAMHEADSVRYFAAALEEHAVRLLEESEKLAS